MKRPEQRSAYTLLEVLVALAIGMLLMLALHYTISTQLGLTRAGRDAISSSTLTRAVFVRISMDVSACLTLVDPNRYKDLFDFEAAAAESETEGTGGTGGTGGTSGTGGTGTDMPQGQAGGLVQTALFPLGVVGDDRSMHLFVSKVPLESFGRPDRPAELTSDVRRISYWLGDQGGLCRVEIKIITSMDALSLAIPFEQEQNCLLAPEVRDVEFAYFDGFVWRDYWDSTELIGDETPVPLGPPRAISVRLGILLPGQPEGSELRYFRHVIAVPSANGNMESDQEGGF